MVSTSIYNRSEIKQYLFRIFKHIDNSDYIKAKADSDHLLHSLLVYYKTRGISANHFYPLFSKLNYYLLYATNNNYKKQIVMDQLELISNEIKTSTKNPLDRLREIFSDIRHLYYALGTDHTTEIIDCFDELADLHSEFEKIGGLTYNLYSQMMRQVGRCESILLKVKKKAINDNLLSTLSDAFSTLFESIHQVLSPPMKLQITPQEVYTKVKEEDVALEDLSAATGQQPDDLRTLLQTEEISRQQKEAMENE